MWKYLVVLMLAFAGVDAYAEDVSPNQGVLGDWGGLRTRLYQDGVDFQLGFTTEAAYNTQGGDSKLLRNADQFVFGATFDPNKLLGWSGGTFQMTITDRNGDNLSADANLGTLMQVQEIYGRGNTFRWTQFWYDQLLFDNVVDVKLGRMGVGEDFMSFSCYFLNLSFCGSLPGNIVSTWYNWPVSQWAARLKINVTPEWYAQIGAYQINPAYIQTSDVFKLNNPSGTIGALIPVEVGWTPEALLRRLAGRLPDRLLVRQLQPAQRLLGGQRQPARAEPGRARAHGEQRVRLVPDGSAAGHDRTRGCLAGLDLFANFVQADRNTATIDQLITVGLFYTGPFDARPQDDLGFAVGRTHVNNNVAQGQELQNANGLGPVAVQSSEYPVELYYTINANEVADAAARTFSTSTTQAAPARTTTSWCSD